MGRKDRKKKPTKVVRKNDSAKASDSKVDTKAAASSSSSSSSAAMEEKKDDYRHSTGVLISQPTARDVKIGNFSLMAYGKELIQDTLIELTIGRRYGLIAPNGAGKTTFMKCLAKREVPIPEHIDIFLLEEEAEPSELTALETVVKHVESRVEQLEKESEKLAEEVEPDDERLLDIYARLDDLNPSTFKTRAGKLLHGLGFQGEMRDKATKDMSGGWRMRVALAQALFVRPTLLLLDEPTNHLDLEACVWLENYLQSYDKCLVVVSHSQDFLNNVCTNIIHITPKQTLEVYGGNYDQYVRTRTENEANQLKQYKKEQDEIKKTKAFIASCGTYSNLVKQAKSRQKQLDKMYAAGLTEKPIEEAVIHFRFPNVEQLAPPVMAFHDVGFAYSGDMKDALYRNLELAIDLDSRIALVGPNGAGKSTLLKLMVQEIQPTEGTIKRHSHLSIGRYHQHSNDQLDGSKTPLEFIQEKFPEVKQEEQQWRALLGRFGVGGQMQTTLISQLSDGQKTRIVFALLAFVRPHILLLDEPTNHLDMNCIDSLAEAINEFSGGLVLVSHDFRLIDQVAKEVWVCDNRSVTKWDGDIRSYKGALVEKMRSEDQ